ncbi:MAG: two-component hybrid sensor and regulator [Gammaproteobacteria bacterium]|nr:two-component hybrid sensor and regulator [Gammaproteobacteria bacterium]
MSKKHRTGYLTSLPARVSPPTLSAVPESPAVPALESRDNRARILWADDNADMREYVRRLLAGHYDVTAVSDGAAAVAAALEAPDTRRRCIEPFYTTKGEHGTGLGLAMVYGMTQRNGGRLEIESAVGKGTTVRLVFPVATSAPTATSHPSQPHAVRPPRIADIRAALAGVCAQSQY